MRKLLVTGGTCFVSRFVAEYFVAQGDDVTVLNRGSREQVEGVTLIKADRTDLGDALEGLEFDAVLDICAYTGEHVTSLLDALDARRRLGITLSPTLLMTPTKSVTAVVGMFDTPQPSTHASCADCFCRAFCNLRATTGRTCHD